MADPSEIYTDAAYQVLRQAHTESRQTRHHYVGPEQLLVGLLVAGEGPAQEALHSLGLSLEHTRATIRQLVGRGAGLVPNRIPYTHKLQRILNFAYGLAQQMGLQQAAPEHLMLGLTQEGDALVARILKQMGFSLLQLQTELLPRLPYILPEKSSATRFYESLSDWLAPYSRGRVWRPIQEIRVSTGDLITGDVLYCSDPLPTEYTLPDLVVQVCNSNRTPVRVRAKLQFLLTVGVHVGILLDPQNHQVEVFRADPSYPSPEICGDVDILALPDLLPGWGIPVDKLWPPVQIDPLQSAAPDPQLSPQESDDPSSEAEDPQE